MERCKEIFELLSELIDNELELEFEKEIMEHIMECECCHHLLNTFKRTVELCHNMEMIEVPEEVHTKLVEIIHIEQKTIRKTGRRKK